MDWTTQRLADEATKQGRPVSREYIRRLCFNGEIEAEKPGRDWIISQDIATAWLARWLAGGK